MQNTQTSNNQYRYDLEERTWIFARDVRKFVTKIPKSIAHIEDAKQVIRSSGSVGANYIEANQAISKKDRVHRMKICKKEARESRFWLSLFALKDTELEKIRQRLVQEAQELELIFASIIKKLS